ncbi:related to cell cycle control protein dicer [Sporisorium reilianum f. sp. reilianum]|uniref:Related to cell cycle control protein dicer n=1 Tax=Sporisorium reilianum f. sp. reilianum TaxID=72559 RepID=A0A2N8UP32_9BASI|nr:related to cell cycle control protein dicer [Sporisorium reilianum f. sp. reilianum]
MSKRTRATDELEDPLAQVHLDHAEPSLDAPTISPQEEERRKRQRIVDRISSQTAVDLSDQLRSDQLAFVPRSYQLELAELAKAGNVLVCLDTGSGKTLISVLLLQHVHEVQNAQRPPSPPQSPAPPAPQRPKVSFFLVNLVPLVHQQSSVIAGHSNLSVGKLYGELKDTVRGKGNKLTVDGWREPQWSALLESHQVIVSTAQCFLDALIHGFIKMDDLNLLIFDEVHHALKNHPFFRIMKYYRLAPEKERPKIFGMTASPIFTSTGQFDDASRYLQKVMNARIHTVSKDTLQDLREVKQKPEELVIEFDPYLTVLDDELDGVQMSALSREMVALFGKDLALDEDAELDLATEHFEKEVRPKLEYTMRHLGPLGCDLLWHSTLLEYRSRARKWVNIDRDKRTLVNDDWILDASMRKSIAVATPEESQESQDDLDSGDGDGDSPTASSQATTGSGLGLGLAVAHLSTNSELNQRILLHMRSQPTLADTLTFDASNTSHKVLRLIETLKCFEPSAADFCAIIFVERRQTATLLVELIKRVAGLEFIHPEFLLGHENGSANGGAPGMDWHDQVQVLNRFRRRKPMNLLVATSIAEEGLDIQAANLVVRFDLFNRHISFLQSRGRARAKQSRFILMAERDNASHAQAILNAFNTEASRAKWLEGIAEAEHDAGFYAQEWQHQLRVERDEAGAGEECIFEPSTGARLFPEDAPSLVSHYAATLHSEYLKDAVLAYKLDSIPHGFGVPSTFSCTLELPSTSAVRSVESGEHRSKKQAKRMVAFKACQQLRDMGELDDYLMPKLLDRAAVLEGAGAGTGKVNAHHKAWRGSGLPVHVPVKNMDGWARFVAAQSGDAAYEATYLALDEFDAACQPLVLLTRGALPPTKLLKLLLPGAGRMKDVKATPLGPLQALSEEELDCAKRFTWFVFRMLEPKDGHGGSAKGKAWEKGGELAVLVVPVRKAHGVTAVHSAADVQLDLPTSFDNASFDVTRPDIAEHLQGRILVRQHGYHSYAFYRFECIRHDLGPNSPLDPSSDDAAAPTYLSQHLKMYGRPHASHPTGQDMLDALSAQLATSPLISVTKMPKIQNLLSPSPRTTSPPARLVVPHFYAVHPLRAPLVSALLLLPSLLVRYDQLLLAHACNATLFASRLDTDLVLEALTSPAAGSSFDYERLEFLGDTFLKLVATCHTFTTHLGRTEAELHLANKAILTNVRLLKEARRVRLERWGVFGSCRCVVRRFAAPRVGGVGGRLVLGEGEEVVVDEDECEAVKEKTLSDMVEALLGAALLTAGPDLALLVCRVFNLLPASITTLASFNDLLLTLKQQAIAENWQSRISRSGLDHLQSLFDHTYRYPHLGLEAFTHPSLLASVLPSYQRLEFLGDAWLDFCIVRMIFAEGEDRSPGEMTAHKGVLASNGALGALGVRLGLHAFVASDSAVLGDSIARYAAALGSVDEKGQYWTRLARGVVVPKAVADVVEASFASIVVDSGFDARVVQRVFERMCVPFYERFCRYDALQVSEVRRVLEFAFATVRRAITHALPVNTVRVTSNLLDIPTIDGDEERIVEALLTQVHAELRIADTVVARITVLPRSAAHLERAVAIARQIDTLQQSLLQLIDHAEHDAQEAGGTAGTVDKLDELQHLTSQLARTLGWKRVFQSIVVETESEVCTLARLRVLILGGEAEGEGSRMEVE